MSHDLIVGMTMRADTADRRRVVFSQPLIDPSFRACGIWSGDQGLIDAALMFLETDAEEDANDLRSVALAMLYVAGDGGTADAIVYLLADRHPRNQLARDRANKQWRNDSGFDGPPDGGLLV